MNPPKTIGTRPEFRFLLVLTFVSALAQQGWTAMYTNFAVDAFAVTGQQTGIIQSLREVPGLLSVGVLLCLLIASERTIIS